jgi:hypothetical protein
MGHGSFQHPALAFSAKPVVLAWGGVGCDLWVCLGRGHCSMFNGVQWLSWWWWLGGGGGLLSFFTPSLIHLSSLRSVASTVLFIIPFPPPHLCTRLCVLLVFLSLFVCLIICYYLCFFCILAFLFLRLIVCLFAVRCLIVRSLDLPTCCTLPMGMGIRVEFLKL